MTNFTANYTEVNERLAKTAKEMNSFNDYKQGTATANQNYYVDEIVKYANELLERNPTEDTEKLEKVQNYIDRYSKKIAEAINKENSIDCRCPSVMICGAGNFPTAKKEKQNNARQAHWEATKDLYNTDRNNYYYNKIRLVLTDSGAIKSDDKNAAQKIKDKIAKLETMPDPYGNKKAEIRRLKERLLILSPDEVKQGKEITINGEPATYENIVNAFNEGAKILHKWERENDETRFYLNIAYEISDGKRKYKCYLSNEVNENCTELSTYGNAETNWQPIWKPLTDLKKFYLMINEVSGSGNKAVIYSILKDLDPTRAEVQQKVKEAKENGEQVENIITINGENATVKANAELMRLQIFFDGKPTEETRSILKSNGFKWSPSQTAWQRLLNGNAMSALERIKDK